MSSLRVAVCADCGWRGFPERLWCPRCASARIGLEAACHGVVEDVTTLRKAPALRPGATVEIGTVRLEAGGRVIARLEGTAPGDRVGLSIVDGAPVARPADDRAGTPTPNRR